jgi:argininosuccinate lyase
MAKLWQKSQSAKTHPLLESYMAKDDVLLDSVLLLYDIEASRAHAKMLQKIGILQADECRKLLTGLDALSKKWKEGSIKITVADEDCHTVIENFLTEYCGNVGKKIHAGRSRNDQVLVATRLYMKAALKEIRAGALDLAHSFLKRAQKYETVPFPGYTHTQQAMLSSLGHYYASFIESLLDDIELLESITQFIDKNPLGSAAGYGVSLPLDREFTTGELGFAGMNINSLYAQETRGKYESAALECLLQLMLTLGRFANDMVLYTSQEFGFFSVEDSLVTGSSIMPQKRNLDGLEILRANVSVIQSHHHLVSDIVKGLTSGYHRDLSLTKKPLIESMQIAVESIEVAKLYLEGSLPKEDVIQSKISKQIFMADLANKLVKEEGVPFRDAYKKAYEEIDTFEVDFAENIASKVSLGAPGNLCLEVYEKRIGDL